MPNDNIVERLSIEIVSQTSKATNELGKVVGELEKLRSVLSGIKMPNMNMGLKQSTADNLKKLADVIYDLKLDKLKAFGDVASGISFKIGINDKTADNLLSFNEAVKSFDSNKLKEFASAASATPKLNLGINAETGLNLRSFAAALMSFPIPRLAELGAINKHYTPINTGVKAETGGNLRSLGDALNAFPIPKLAELGAVSKYFTKLNIGVQADTGNNLQSLGQSLKTFPMPKLAELGAVSKYYTKLDLGISATTAKNLASFASSIADLDIQKLEQLARINFSNLAVLGEASEKLQGLNGALERLSKTAERVEKAQAKVASATRSVHRETRTSTHHFKLANTALGKLFNSIKRIAFYRLIRSAIRSITKGFSEGIENLYRWSQAWNTSFAPAMDQLKTAQLYLKNGFASMFSPLIEYAIPIIDRVIDRIVDMFNAVQELFAQLTGAATWNKAIKYPVKYKEDLDDASKSAKALQNILMDFDEINAINTPSSGSGKSGKEQEDYSKMFELVKTSTKSNSALGKFIDFLKSLDFEPLKQSLQSLWNDGLSPILSYFAEHGEEFLSPLVKFFVEEGLPTAIDLVTVSLGKMFELIQPSLENGFFEDVAGKLSKINDHVKDFSDFIAELDVKPLGEALSTLWTDGVSPLGDWLIDNFGWIQENVIEPITEFLVEKGIPAAIDTITEALKSFKSALDPVVDGLKKFWEENGEWIMELLEEHTMTALGKIKEAFEKIGQFFTKNGDKIRSIFSNVSTIVKDLSPFIKGIAAMLGTNAWDTFIDSILSVLDAVQPILDLVSGLLNLLTAFTDADKNKFVLGLKEIGQAIWDALVAPLKEGLRAFATFLDTFGQADAAHAIRVFIGDEVEEVVDHSVKTVEDGSVAIMEIVDDTSGEVVDVWKAVDRETGDYVSITGARISSAQNEINKELGSSIGYIIQFGSEGAKSSEQVQKWLTYCAENGVDPLTGKIIFAGEKTAELSDAINALPDSKTVEIQLDAEKAKQIFDDLKLRATNLNAALSPVDNTPKWAKQTASWSTFASGGFPDMTSGSLFIAGESGVPELMGTVGGRTAVAGGHEITGIREAIEAQGAREEGLLRQLISAVANKDLSLVANSSTGRWVNKALKAYAGVTG